MRLFIAVDFSQQSKDLIIKQTRALKSSLENNYRWVDSKNFHLTLKFIPEADKQLRNSLVVALEESKLSLLPEYLEFDRLGAFPDLAAKKVLYLATANGTDQLKSYRLDLEKKLMKTGLMRDKRNFIPHLTLARQKNQAEVNIEDKFLENSFINIYAKLKRIALYESKLDSAGSEYRQLFSLNLI
jgi:2'-5' RNA ligase